MELGVSDKVTTFTASGFGRTLTSNGDGTDHSWGSHQMMMVSMEAKFSAPCPSLPSVVLMTSVKGELSP
ncbi:DUF1501 domain-containing protein [Luminiphilus sp.]|nr:DUF1501 domain-containing protein [Luminiphilus sp.]